MTVRRFEPDLSDLPRYWYADDPVMTHFVNGLNLVFPDGERFFIRSVRRYAKDLDDPALQARVRDFIGQEAQHGHAHDRLIEVLEEQGFEVADWLRWYRHVAYTRIEPWTPPLLRLSATAALEHFTARFARRALEQRFLDQAHEGVRDLLLWHAAEEIEHRSVAYDVYCAAGGGYLVRILGLLIATATFVLFWRSASRHLLAQEPEVDRQRVRAAVRRARARGQDRDSVIRDAFLSYLRPGFHPDEDPSDDALAAGYLTSIGRLAG